MDERVRQDSRGITTAPALPAVAAGGVARPARPRRWWLWPRLVLLGAPLLLPLAGGVAFRGCAPANNAPRNCPRPTPAPAVLDVAEVPGVVCKAHRKPLRTDHVPIAYGLIRTSEKEERDRAKLFPWANERWPGGCEPKEPQAARVSYCPACRQALAEWKRANPGE